MPSEGVGAMLKNCKCAIVLGSALLGKRSATQHLTCEQKQPLFVDKQADVRDEAASVGLRLRLTQPTCFASGIGERHEDSGARVAWMSAALSTI